MNDAVFDHAARLHQAGNLLEAARLYSDVLRSNPRHFEALYRLAAIHFEHGRFKDAEHLFSTAIRLNDAVPEAHYSRGCALQKLDRHQDALHAFARALALRPGYIEARNNRGSSLLSLNRHEEALASFDRILAERPDAILVHINRASALSGLKRYGEALVACDRVLAVTSHDAYAWYNRGVALYGLFHLKDALASFDKAVAIRPDYKDALTYRGVTLAAMNRHEEALSDFDKAIEIASNDPDLRNNRCNALVRLFRFEETIPEYEKLIKLDPNYKYARGNLLYSRMEICDWRSFEDHKAKLVADVRAGRPVLHPRQIMLVAPSAADQRISARLWTAMEHPSSPEPLWRGERYEHDRIRVAYVSGDFQAHAVSILMAGVFEHHDRTRFETIAISLGNDDRSGMRARLTRAFELFIDAGDKSDLELAKMIREMEVDIAVDLMGFTGSSRTSIFAHRPAPIQVNYLGFAGTMGASYMDYILADKIVIPESEREHYDEKVVYLPGSYMPQDDTRKIADRIPSRGEAGLPETGFVFASFNNSYKFTPEMFDIWMRLLVATKGSVLWLPESNAAAMANLKREAQARGVSPERLIFAPFAPLPEDHLARLSLADLFLDTRPYNAHSTAADALWAGLPVLTCMGHSFAGRVAASLLQSVGLPELITSSLADYEGLALKLARDPAALADIKVKLKRQIKSHPLLDTASFTRHLEAALLVMHERQLPHE